METGYQDSHVYPSFQPGRFIENRLLWSAGETVFTNSPEDYSSGMSYEYLTR